VVGKKKVEVDRVEQDDYDDDRLPCEWRSGGCGQVRRFREIHSVETCWIGLNSMTRTWDILFMDRPAQTYNLNVLNWKGTTTGRVQLNENCQTCIASCINRVTFIHTLIS